MYLFIYLIYLILTTMRNGLYFIFGKTKFFNHKLKKVHCRFNKSAMYVNNFFLITYRIDSLPVG